MSWKDDELADLRLHWGGAYEICYAGRTFSALRRDGFGSLTALTADGLRGLIRQDYARHPVPREVQSGHA
jgi:hypothetical protein